MSDSSPPSLAVSGPATDAAVAADLAAVSPEAKAANSEAARDEEEHGEGVVKPAASSSTAGSTPTLLGNTLTVAPPTPRRSRGSAPPESLSSARARQDSMDLSRTKSEQGSAAEQDDDTSAAIPAAVAAVEADNAADTPLATADGVASTSTANTVRAAADVAAAAVAGAPSQQRRVTRASTHDKRKAVAKSDAAVKDEEEDAPLLLPTATLLFTTSPPSSATVHPAPALPVTLQSLIEVPEFRQLAEGELPMGRLRIQPNSGQQTDFSDDFYLRRHMHGEFLERKGRKQERDKLVVERNRLKHQVEQLRLDLASLSYFANASPVKGAAAAVFTAGSNPTSGGPASAAMDKAASASASKPNSSRASTPSGGAGGRLKESERNKRKQLNDTEEMLRRYDELLEPRAPYVPFNASTAAANGKQGSVPAASSAPRTWTTGGKGIPPPPEGISPSDFLNAPRSMPVIQGQDKSKISASTDQQHGKGSSIVAQRRIASQAAGSRGSSPASSPAPASAGGRVTRSRSSSPAVMAPLAPKQHSSAHTSTAALASHKSSTTAYSPPLGAAGSPPAQGNAELPPGYVPILPKPSTSGAYIPLHRRLQTSPVANSSPRSGSEVPKAGPSAVSLVLRQPERGTPSAHSGDVSGDGPLASRRRTRALQPIDVGLTRSDNTSQSPYTGIASKPSAYGTSSAAWTDPLGTGQIRPRKRRRRRRKENSDDDDGRREALAEMEASMEFIENDDDEAEYVRNLQSSYASSFQHTQPLGAPDDPDDADTEEVNVPSGMQVDSPGSRPKSQPPTPRAFSGRGRKRTASRDFALLASTPTKVQPSASTPIPERLTHPSPKIPTPPTSASLANGGAYPPVPPILPKIHVERAASASASVDEPAPRKLPRAATSRASTPAIPSQFRANLKRHPRLLFQKPQGTAKFLQPTALLTAAGSRSRHASPALGKIGATTGKREVSALARLSAVESAALNSFDSEGDLSSLPSDSDEPDNASEWQDNLSRFRDERATRVLELTDPRPPAFLNIRSPSIGVEELPNVAAPSTSQNGNSLLANVLDPNVSVAASGKVTKRRAGRAASATPDPGQVTVGGLRTRRRPLLDDYPVNDLAEIMDSQRRMLRVVYQDVAHRKAETIGSRYYENPLGEWQVYISESHDRVLS